MEIIEWIRQPWPWWVAGPMIGLMVPALLIFGNKSFGISSSLRHICAACFPSKIPFFSYNWKQEAWNLFFVAGILFGGYIAFTWLRNDLFPQVSPRLFAELREYGIYNYNGLVPSGLFNWQELFTARGMIMMAGGGFLVGFGTRYAGGCTSGHSIMGLSNLQWPSLVATICFMIGGFFTANIILPYILKL